jgi:hypothetical protein
LFCSVLFCCLCCVAMHASVPLCDFIAAIAGLDHVSHIDWIAWEMFYDFIAAVARLCGSCVLTSPSAVLSLWVLPPGHFLLSSSGACSPSCSGVLPLYMTFSCGGLWPLLTAMPAPSCARYLGLKCTKFCSGGFLSPTNRPDVTATKYAATSQLMMTCVVELPSRCGCEPGAKA